MDKANQKGSSQLGAASFYSHEPLQSGFDPARTRIAGNSTGCMESILGKMETVGRLLGDCWGGAWLHGPLQAVSSPMELGGPA